MRENGDGEEQGDFKQLHFDSTCQTAVIVKPAPAVHCTLLNPRPVRYAMLDQEGVLLWPTPDPRSVKVLPVTMRMLCVDPCSVKASLYSA